jgi:tellurite resistance protein
MGLFGLGLALRRGAEAIGYPPGIAELVLGAVCLLWGFSVLGYLAKTIQRMGVVMEDLAILPGRAGLAALSLGVLLLAATLQPYSSTIASGLLFCGLALHFALAVLIVLTFYHGPAEARHVTPVWHLHFVGFIIGAVSAAPLGYEWLSTMLLILTGVIAAVIWILSGIQLAQNVPPAPLRPLLAIHLAPASLLGIVASLTGHAAVAQGFAIFGGLILLALLLYAGWITASGFSALWGAFTFPLASYASLLLALKGMWLWPGLVILIAAIGIVPAIAIKVLQAWMRGSLAAKTNAATA